MTQVTKAVVTVPAKFTPAQKRATGEAYKRAGLKVRMSGVTVFRSAFDRGCLGSRFGVGSDKGAGLKVRGDTCWYSCFSSALVGVLEVGSSDRVYIYKAASVSL